MPTEIIKPTHYKRRSRKTKHPHSSSWFTAIRFTPGFKVFVSLTILLSVFFVTHLIKFPGSVAYLKEVTGGQKTFDLQASFSAAETYNRLVSFGPVGRQQYIRTMLTVDLIFPLSMFMFLFLFLKYSFTHIRIPYAMRKGILTLSIGYLFFDFLENFTIFSLLLNYPERLDFMGSQVGYLTSAKRIFMIFAIIIPAILLTAGKLINVYQWKRNE